MKLENYLKLAETIDRLKVDNYKLIKENYVLNERLNDQYEVLEELFHEIEELEEENDVLDEHCDSLYEKVCDLETKNDMFLDDKLTLKEHLDKSVIHINRLQEKNNELNTKFEKLQKYSKKNEDGLIEQIVDLEEMIVYHKEFEDVNTDIINKLHENFKKENDKNHIIINDLIDYIVELEGELEEFYEDGNAEYLNGGVDY